ncbi:MAG: hypothetical protein LYZ69_04945 [Nitrososphaerales archaeon]|nr:hypothetical protein [Nitrososphaerales archaeon]
MSIETVKLSLGQFLKLVGDADGFPSSTHVYWNGGRLFAITVIAVLCVGIVYTAYEYGEPENSVTMQSNQLTALLKGHLNNSTLITVMGLTLSQSRNSNADASFTLVMSNQSNNTLSRLVVLFFPRESANGAISVSMDRTILNPRDVSFGATNVPRCSPGETYLFAVSVS